MSMMSAPSSTRFLARRIASSGVLNFPPSENESGVTLTMPWRYAYIVGRGVDEN